VQTKDNLLHMSVIAVAEQGYTANCGENEDIDHFFC